MGRSSYIATHVDRPVCEYHGRTQSHLTRSYRIVSPRHTHQLIPPPHLVSFPPLLTVAHRTFPLPNQPPPPNLNPPPFRPSPSNHPAKFLHWLTSRTSNLLQPSSTASTPTPVTRTHPLTLSSFRDNRCRPIERREGSETAEPQKERFRWVRCGQPRARTSVAVSERAQQKD
jgi:hypothetical protein